MVRFARLTRPAWFAVLATWIGATVFAAVPAGQLAFTIDLPPGRTPAEISGTLVAISSARTWTVKAKADDRLVINLVHRKVDATVTYVFSAEKIVAYCEGYQVDSKGKRGKPEQPERWLKFLQEDIRRLLVTAPAVIPLAPVAQGPSPGLKPATEAKGPPPPPLVASDAVTKDPFPPMLPLPPPGSAPLPPPAPASESVQFIQFPAEAVSPLSYYARVYLLRPRGPAEGGASFRIFDETPGTQGGGPGRAIEIGALEDERVLGWNRPAGILSLRADTGTRVTPRLALELAAGRAYYIVVERNGPTPTFRQLPEPEGHALVAASKPATVNDDAPDSLDAYLLAAAGDGRTDAVKKFLTADRGRSYERALAASIDQAQPQVTNMLVKAGATLPTENTPDARFRMGAIQKALADTLVEEGKPTEAKKYYEQAMALFAAVKPELQAAAETKFQKAKEGATAKPSMWSTLATTATKALLAGAAGGGTAGGAPSGGSSSQAAVAQLLALKDSGTFDQFFGKLKASGAASPSTSSLATNKEIPKEVVALLEEFTNKAVLDKTLSDRCDLLIAEIKKKMVQ